MGLFVRQVPSIELGVIHLNENKKIDAYLTKYHFSPDRVRSYWNSAIQDVFFLRTESGATGLSVFQDGFFLRTESGATGILLFKTVFFSGQSPELLDSLLFKTFFFSGQSPELLDSLLSNTFFEETRSGCCLYIFLT
jgi:hypothetical protein